LIIPKLCNLPGTDGREEAVVAGHRDQVQASHAPEASPDSVQSTESQLAGAAEYQPIHHDGDIILGGRREHGDLS